MSVTLSRSDRSEVPLALSDAEVTALLERVLAHEGVERPCEVSLSVVGSGEMAELNGELRGIGRPTDVLSVEIERPDDPDLAPGEPCTLGDIVLDPAYIRDQAARLATNEADETRLLLVHGMLHLLGYDHEEEAQAELMEATEDAIVAAATEGRVVGVGLEPHGPGPHGPSALGQGGRA